MADEIIVRIKAEGSKQFIKELKQAGIAVQETGDKAKKSSDKVGAATKKISKSIKQFGATIAAAFTVAKITQFANESVKAFNAFDASLKELQAITGLAANDLDRLAEASKQLSAESTKSSAEVLEAFKLIGSAKPELLQDVQALEELTSAAITLSEASGLTLPEAATVLGNSLNALQLPAEDAGRLINVLAAASQKGAKEIPFVSEALSKFGGIASQAGVSVEESVAAVETLGKAIPEASIVGTNLRNVLIKLQVAAAEEGREFKSLGEELERLAPKQQNITALTEQFGDRNLLAVQTLIANRDELENLEAQITATNTAYEQQAIVNSSAEAVLKKYNNAVNALKVNVGASLTEGLKPLLLGLTDTINRFNDTRTASERLNDQFKEQTSRFEDQVKALDNLVPRYENLTAEGELTTEQQDELKSVTESIAQIVPDAVVEWDKYGDALKINTGRIKDFKDEQNAVLQVLGEKAINKATRAYGNQARRIRETTGRLEDFQELQRQGIKTFTETTGAGEFATQTYIDVSDEIARLTAEQLKYQTNAAVQAQVLQENGVAISAYQQSLIDLTIGLLDADGGTEELTESQKALIDEFATATGVVAVYDEATLKLAEAWKKAGDEIVGAAGSIDALSTALKEAQEQLKLTSPDSPLFEKLTADVLQAESELELVKKKYEELQKLIGAGIAAQQQSEEFKIEIEAELATGFRIDEIEDAIKKIEDEAEQRLSDGIILSDQQAIEEARRLFVLNEELKTLKSTLEETQDIEPIEIEISPVVDLPDFDDSVLQFDISQLEEETDKFWEDFQENAEETKKRIDAIKDSIQGIAAATATAASGFDAGAAFQSITDLSELLSDPETDNFEKGLSAASTALNNFSNFEQAITDTRLRRLEAQRDAGLITEKEFAQKRAEIVRQEAIVQKSIAVSQAIVNTALGITAQFQAGPAGIGLAAAVAALGAIQVALILAQPIPPIPGFEKGTKGNKVAPPGMKWVGESGRELIMDSGGYKIINNKDSEEIMKILGGYGVPVQFADTAEEINKPLSELTPIKRLSNNEIDWNPLLSSHDRNRSTIGRKLDRLHEDLEALNRAQRKRKMNARI